ncbi:hypothetical protein DSO57_1039109, partial [Entomophthora muscae]
MGIVHQPSIHLSVEPTYPGEPSFLIQILALQSNHNLALSKPTLSIKLNQPFKGVQP